MKFTRALKPTAQAVLAAVTLGIATAASASGGAIINNGTIQLGVHDQGHLNVDGGPPSSGSGTPYVGVRYMPTGAEATAPGCLCEGWGAGDFVTGISGYANEASGSANLNVVSFSADADSATSVVNINDGLGAPLMRVTHDYQPSITPDLYEVTVTIENVSSAAIDPVYRRVMDWDVEPTAFFEYVTFETGTSTELVNNSNGGFSSSNPFAPDDFAGSLGVVRGDFVDFGPDDHGALFDFRFETLAPGESKTFKTYYGAAGNEAGALAALASVEAETYSLGQPSSSDPTDGSPNTFIFAFGGVGGTPVFEPASISLTPETGLKTVGESYCVSALVLDATSNPFVGAPIEFARSGANPGSATLLSGGDGTAQHCWVGASTGTDSILATTGLLSDSASVVWEAAAPTPASISLTPDTGSKFVGQSHCVSALVLDGSSAPFPGASVAFVRTGVHPASLTVTTGPDGQAQQCWTGTKNGTDMIVASVGSLSDTASMVWKAKTKTKLVAEPAVAKINALESEVTLELRATLTNLTTGKAIGYKTVTFRAANELICTAKTNAKGHAVCKDIQLHLLPTVLAQEYRANFAGDSATVGSTATGALITGLP